MGVLEIDSLSVSRGAFTLGPIALGVGSGEVVCVAGPNGSGKTTLLDALLGVVRASSRAQVRFFDEAADFRSRGYLRRVGHLPDDPDLILGELTAQEYWRFVARTRDRDRAEDSLRRADKLADRLNLDTGKVLIRAFSHGMRKKTQLVAALMHEPDLLLIDELRNGLDPIASRIAESLIAEARMRGAGVLVSTHDLYWAERNADQVVFLNGGEVVAAGSPKSLVGDGDASLEDSFLRLIGWGLDDA